MSDSFMYADTHTHLTDERYNGQAESIIGALSSFDIKFIINIGYDALSSKQSFELATKFDNVYCAVAIHPHDCLKASQADYDDFKKYANSQKVVAIGETGLDYHYDDGCPHDVQKKVFIEHLELANSLNLPVIIHLRDAYEDMFNILSQNKGLLGNGGVLHCYSGSSEMAKRYLEFGLYISFAGAITFKNAKGLTDAVKAVPIDRILTETDCPYLTPEPHRGKLNYPQYVGFVAQKIAELKGVSVEKLNENVLQNACRLFKRIKI